MQKARHDEGLRVFPLHLDVNESVQRMMHVKLNEGDMSCLLSCCVLSKLRFEPRYACVALVMRQHVCARQKGQLLRQVARQHGL